jgi:tRNA dimethylallyltransferase
MKQRDNIIIISGATATGKTSLAITKAKSFRQQNIPAVVVNFDSLLFYRELNIGTAKPTVAEMQEIPHKMINIQSAHHPLNAHDFSEQALKVIQKYRQQHYQIILVGGSGFYLRALLKGMYNSPPISLATKRKLVELEAEYGYDYLRQLLKQHDVASFNTIHHNDRYRTLRALEHFLEHQTPLSIEQQKFQQNGPYDLAQNIHNWDITHYYLTVEKKQHWEMILQRTELMIKQGLITEVETLLQQGFTGDEKPLQSIGYKETIDYLHHKIKTQDELIERIFINTRRLAKAQKTFFNKITPKETLQKGVNY